jgi:hypothetical protein
LFDPCLIRVDPRPKKIGGAQVTLTPPGPVGGG